MMRFIVLGLLIVALWLAVDNFASRIKGALSAGSPNRPGLRPEKPAPQSELLLPCATCGAYVPAGRALKPAGASDEAQVYCSEECQRRGTLIS